MTSSPADEYRDRELIQTLTQHAAAIFARHGIDFSTARRGGGWTNATWLAGGLVLRMAVEAGNDNLLREARLARLLPAGTGYPALVESGSVGGHAFTLAREVPGRCLGEAWPDLSWEQRAVALRELWQRAEAVHSLSVEQVSGVARTRAWFNSCDVAEAARSLVWVVDQRALSQQEADVLSAMLERFWQALPEADLVLNHGDMTLDNAMWHAGHISALLDFEYALTTPAHLDLNHLVKIVFGPQDPGDPQPDPDGSGQVLLMNTVAEIAHPYICTPAGKDLLSGYAVLLDLWLLKTWLEHPDGEGPLETWNPRRRLVALADGHCGYLSALWEKPIPPGGDARQSPGR